MTPLRQKMIDAMQVRGFSVRTHRSYLSAVADLARYYRRSPDQVSGEELQAFFVYLAKGGGLSGASCRLYLNAIRFFYLHVLRRDSFSVTLVGAQACTTHSGVIDARGSGPDCIGLRQLQTPNSADHLLWLRIEGQRDGRAQGAPHRR